MQARELVQGDVLEVIGRLHVYACYLHNPLTASVQSNINSKHSQSISQALDLDYLWSHCGTCPTFRGSRKSADVKSNYEWPTTGLGLYSSSKYFSSSSLSVFPLAPIDSSILSMLLKPIIGLLTFLLIQASATWLIFQSFFSASSCTRLIISISVSLSPLAGEFSFSPLDRVVLPYWV